MLTHLIVVLLGISGAVAKNLPAKCTKENTGFFVTDNASLKNKEGIVYKETSEEDCLNICSENKDSNGKQISCQSFNYDHSTFSCTVYTEKASPVGSGELEQIIGKRYFEKICYPRNIPSQCAQSQFIRVDQSVLVGYAANLTLVDSIELCVAQCIQEPDCKSAMYFYEDGECITNKQSALTKPAAFSKEANDKVVYFQNGCDLKKIEEKSQEEGDVVEEEASDRKVEAFTQISETTPKAMVVESEEEATTSAEQNLSEEADYEEEGNETEDLEEAGEDIGEEIELTTTTTTTTTTTEAPKPKHIKPRKIKKHHPKNFGSKTYEILKKQETEKKEKTINVEDLEEITETPVPKRKLNVRKYKVEVEPEIEQETEQETETEQDPELLYFSEWSDWTPCTKSQEKQTRRRRCLNLRRCLGSLMQVQECPVIVSTTPSHVESVKSIVSVSGEEEDYDVPMITNSGQFIANQPFPTQHQQQNPPLLNEQVWGPWQGVCQHFASSQPCNNGNMIGFESRECIAKDPSQCEGPFFRYCTLTC